MSSDLFIFRKDKIGFTLIELLVVITIIGLLAILSVLALNSTREKAKREVTIRNLVNISKAIGIAESETGKTLLRITTSNCTYCYGSCSSRDLREVPETDTCYVRTKLALNKIETAAAGLAGGTANIMRDAWGSPLTMDENEGESNCSTKDVIISAGPDGTLLNADDIRIYPPLSGNCQ